LKWANAKAPTPVPQPNPPTPAPVPPQPVPQPQPVPDAGNFIMYTVKTGDSLSVIAKNNKTTIEIIMSLNPQIKSRSIIVEGWVLKIPTV
jgi:LysM repeat protein